ncbi:MFS transporter [Shewanella canadensis]|nr:MFS transporter [Shewanella canadensis]
MTTSKMPLQVWILTLSAFAIGTAEFVIAGLLTTVSESLHITEGQAGNLITAYALSIVIGGPILTLGLARFDKRKVLIGLMGLFVIGNIIAAFTTNYHVLLLSRVIAGLTQGPFYGIGAVVATSMVPNKMAGRAVGQMFAGLTLANVLGVPGGSFIGQVFGWNSTFIVVAALGVIAALAIAITIPSQGKGATVGISSQLKAFKNWNLVASLLITTLSWVGFMGFYGYIAPIAESVAGFSRADVTWILIIVGLGLVIGNVIGGKTADNNLSLSLIMWPIAMVISLAFIGMAAPYKIPFVIASFIFGIASFANVPSLQMRVMKYGAEAPELTATANISAFNIANALGGAIGAYVVDSTMGASMIPYAAMLIPVIGIIFIMSQETRAAQKVAV